MVFDCSSGNFYAGTISFWRLFVKLKQVRVRVSLCQKEPVHFTFHFRQVMVRSCSVAIAFELPAVSRVCPYRARHRPGRRVNHGLPDAAGGRRPTSCSTSANFGPSSAGLESKQRAMRARAAPRSVAPFSNLVSQSVSRCLSCVSVE